MANLMDYLVWRGEFDFSQTPWNEVDALMMANLCYLNFHGIDDERGWTLAEARRQDLVRETLVTLFHGRKAQFEAMADSRRFGDIRMHHFINATDDVREVQFSATCYDLPDGTLCIGFRGTDGTFVGWREDFNMSYRSPVPAQEAAVRYLEKAAELDGRPIRLTGHSKGGNLAMYAAACCSPEVQERLMDIWSFDGPGMNPEVFCSENYQRIAGKIRSFVPQTSVIGMLMSYPIPYTVVLSNTSNAFLQHDPLRWQVYGPRFETRERIDEAAEMIRDTFHEWLEKSAPEERSQMVDSLFDLLEATQTDNFSDMKNDGFRSVLAMMAGTRDMNQEARRNVIKMGKLFLSLGFGTLADRYRLKMPVWKTEGAGKKSRNRLTEKPDGDTARLPEEEPEESSGEERISDPAGEGGISPENQEIKG